MNAEKDRFFGLIVMSGKKSEKAAYDCVYRYIDDVEESHIAELI